MVKYIKDGAYTIVVEDEKEKKIPPTEVSNITETWASDIDTKDDGKHQVEYSSDAPPDSQMLGRGGAVGQSSMGGVIQEMDEDIDFASPAFIFRNLSIARISKFTSSSFYSVRRQEENIQTDSSASMNFPIPMMMFDGLNLDNHTNMNPHSKTIETSPLKPSTSTIFGNSADKDTGDASIFSDSSVAVNDRISISAADHELLSGVSCTGEDPELGYLRSRIDVAEILAHQIFFLIYISLMPFTQRGGGTASGQTSRMSSARGGRESRASSATGKRHSGSTASQERGNRGKSVNPATQVEYLPSILIFGDGLVGMTLIRLLSRHGCAPLLRVYCRGDVGAAAWRAKGLKASSSLKTLMKASRESSFHPSGVSEDEKPEYDMADIIVLTMEQQNVHQVSNLLDQLNIVSPRSAVISAALGLSRRRLLQIFGTPTILRCYVEPWQIRRLAEKRIIKQQLDAIEAVAEKAREAALEVASLAPVAPAPIEDVVRSTPEIPKFNSDFASSLAASLASLSMAQQKDVVTDTDSDDDLSIHSDNSYSSADTSVHKKKKKPKNGKLRTVREMTETMLTELSRLSYCDYAIRLLMERTGSITNILSVLETYYVLNGLAAPEARKVGLRALLGHNERMVAAQSASQTPRRRAAVGMNNTAVAKRGRLKMSTADRSILGMFSGLVSGMHRQMLMYVSMENLLTLVDGRQSVVTGGAAAMGVSPEEHAANETAATAEIVRELGSSSKVIKLATEMTQAGLSLQLTMVILEADDDVRRYVSPALDMLVSEERKDHMRHK